MTQMSNMWHKLQYIHRMQNKTAVKRSKLLIHVSIWMNLKTFCKMKEVRYRVYIVYNFLNKFILFIYFWLHWVFVAECGLSLVAGRGGYSLLRYTDFSLQWLLLLQSTGSRCTAFSSCGMRASVVVVHRLSSSAACGIFPDQGSNPCPLHWQADS